MTNENKATHGLFLLIVGLVSWIIPGGGYFLIEQKKRGLVVTVTIVFTFALGLYIASIGAVDPVGHGLWYIAQMMASPLVALIGHMTAAGAYPVYGRPCELGQIYTSIAGLLNVLCIVNAVYSAYLFKLSYNGVR